jgi:flavin reductase (DIM6/NTAB) family NADH-FMN oxidoreductase RutF
MPVKRYKQHRILFKVETILKNDPGMLTEPTLPMGEMLRAAMRRWVTGVAIVTSQLDGMSHGMTVNSFGSISLNPPLVTVTMNQDTRTCHLVQQSGLFAVTVLSIRQQTLAELFAGRIDEGADRMTGLDTFTLVTGAPFIRGGLAFVDCRVVYQYPLHLSTLFLGEVVAAQTAPPAAGLEPLVYFNRMFTRLG